MSYTEEPSDMSITLQKLKQQAYNPPVYAKELKLMRQSNTEDHNQRQPLMCFQCDKILYKLHKIFGRIHNIHREQGVSGVQASTLFCDEVVDEYGILRKRGKEMEGNLIDFKWSLTGSTPQDQTQLMALLDRFSS